MASNNNATTTKFKVDISELKSAMQEAKKQVAYANSEFKAASSSMNDWSKSSDGISAKLKQLNSNLKSQETILNEYEKTLEEVKKEYGENSAEALDYATKLNNQQAVVNKIKKEMANYEDTLREVSEAEKIAAETGKDVAEVLADVGNEADDAGDGFTIFKGAIADFVGNALTSLVSGLKDAIVNMATFGDEVDKAMNSFKASTGATAEEMADFESTMKNIYNANFGESFDDIAKSMGEVKRVAGDIGADELESMTTNALILRDTFDFEVSESMRAVNSLMDQFGITADEAFNLMAQGAQSGLNQNGDLLDVINEYSVHFERAGYSADEMFNMLANGVEAGTWSVDKLGDAFKEFNIRMSDGSAKDAIEALGFSWESVSESWSAGGDEAKEVFNMLINEMDGMEDSVDGYGIGVGLLGTMFEDLGYDALNALSNVEGEFDATKKTMEEINAVKYDSVGEALQGIGRNIQTGILLPISEKLLPIMSELVTKFQEWLNDPATQQGIKTLTDSIVNFISNGLTMLMDGIQWFLNNKDAIISGVAAIAAGFVALGTAYFIQNFSSILSSFKTWATATKLVTAAQTALNAVQNASPIGILITLIAAVVGAIITFIATNEDARAKFLEIWGNIVDGLSKFVKTIGDFFTKTIPAFFKTLIEWVKVNWQAILLFLINPFAGLFQYFYDNNYKFREFVDNAIAFIKQLPEKAWVWLQNTISKVAQFAIDLGTKAKEAGQKLLDSIIGKAKEIPEKIRSVGSDIVKGLWNGINDMVGWIGGKIKSFGDGVLNGLKDFFGIHSPSKLMADEVGKWLPEGIAVGISDNAKSVLGAMKDVTVGAVNGARAGLSSATTTLGGGSVAGGGVVNNFTQVINSPKQLSRLDIYRQSKNLLGYAGGGM